jgi:hypothetical protein
LLSHKYNDYWVHADGETVKVFPVEAEQYQARVFLVSMNGVVNDFIRKVHLMALLNKGVQERHREPGRCKRTVPASSFEEAVVTRGGVMGERLCLGGEKRTRPRA